MSEPIHLLSLGFGVQSSTTALMASRGLITPKPYCGIFADTQDEPASVYAWKDWMVSQLTFPVRMVTAGKLSDASLKMRTTKDNRSFSQTNIPFFTKSQNGELGRITHRSCTADFKLKPIIKECRSIVGKPAFLTWRRNHKKALTELFKWQKECVTARKENRTPPVKPHSAWQECQSDPLVIQWIGISVDEVSRMKDSRDPWILNRWPLIEQRMTRADCLAWMKSQGYPKPPRSACVYCPFHDNAEWKNLKANEPEEFKKAVIFEREIQRTKSLTGNFSSMPFLHRSCVPIDEVDFDQNNKGKDQAQFDFQTECMGMCNT